MSKGEYVQMWGVRLGLVGITNALSGLMLLSVSITVLSLLGLVLCLCTGAGFTLPCLAFCTSFALLSYLTYNLWQWGKDSLNYVANPHDAVPLTRANTADLPAPDSLVRASQEPAQAQEGVLLRVASGEAQAGQEEQLLRASVGGQE